MNVAEAFATYQLHVDADPAAVKEARSRARTFKDAFEGEPDVPDVFTSGSLARKTHKDPIHDVDVVIIYNKADHPEWGEPGDSAEAALDATRARVNELLGATSGTYAHLVRLAKWRNHAVKCFIDDPNDDDAFTVDAMPALRDNGHLLVPEAVSKTWVETDPEHLIDAVNARQAGWSKYQGTVRMLKVWATNQTGIEVKSLVLEVLALDFLPFDGTLQPVAVKNFFIAAAAHIEAGYKVEDPAGYCGEVQPSLDYEEFGTRLRNAANLAVTALAKQAQSDDAAAIQRWHDLFGDGFPKPPKTTPAPGVVPPVAPERPRPVKDTPQG